MLAGTTILLVVAKTVTVVFGGLVTLLTVRAYLRTRSRSMRALAIGLSLLLVGALVGGVLHQVSRLPLGQSVGVQSVFTAAGFAVIAYSLYTREAPTGTRTSPGRGTGRSGE